MNNAWKVFEQESKGTKMASAGNSTFESKQGTKLGKKSGQGLDDTENKSYYQCILRLDRGQEGGNRKNAESSYPCID